MTLGTHSAVWMLVCFVRYLCRDERNDKVSTYVIKAGETHTSALIKSLNLTLLFANFCQYDLVECNLLVIPFQLIDLRRRKGILEQ